MQYQLVLQIPEGNLTYDDIILIEDQLIKYLHEESADLDGHDLGNGEINFFIFTSDTILVLKSIQELLNDYKGVNSYKVAYRKRSEELYTQIWPPGGNDFNIT